VIRLAAAPFPLPFPFLRTRPGPPAARSRELSSPSPSDLPERCQARFFGIKALEHKRELQSEKPSQARADLRELLPMAQTTRRLGGGAPGLVATDTRNPLCVTETETDCKTNPLTCVGRSRRENNLDATTWQGLNDSALQ
jgi:hypothetical protein